MKKTQFVVLLRDIRSTAVSFISIVVFIALSISMFLGIKWTAPSLENTADRHYTEYSFHDFNVAFPYGIADEDIDAITAIDPDCTVEGGYTAYGSVKIDGEQYVLSFLSLTEKMDFTTVIEGSAPSAVDEIGIERLFAEETGIKIGDKLSVSVVGTELGSLLKCSEFTVAAIVEHPAYYKTNTEITKGSCSVGDGIVDYYTVLSVDAFDRDAYDGCFSNVYIRYEVLRDLNTFGDEYIALSAEIEEKLDALGRERGVQRYNELVDEYEAVITDAEAQIADGEVQIADAEAQITDAEAQITDAEAQIADAELQIADGEAELTAAEQQYSEKLELYNDGKSELESGKVELTEALTSEGYSTDFTEAKTQIESDLAMLYTARDYLIAADVKIQSISAGNDSVSSDDVLVIKEIITYLRSMGYSVSMFPEDLSVLDIEYFSAHGVIDELGTAVQDGLSSVNAMIDGLNLLTSGIVTYQEGEYQLIEANRQLISAHEQITEGRAKLADAKAELASGKAELAEKKAELEDGKALLAEKKDELADGKIKVDEAKDVFDQLLSYDCWIISDRKDNADTSMVSSNAELLEKICYTMAFLFIFVGAMVCYTAVARLIRDNQVLIGVQKALGFSKREVTLRYMIYSLLAVLIGVAAGVLLGYYVLSWFMQSSYMRLYTFTAMQSYFSISDTLLISAVELVIIFFATWLACKKLLAKRAVELLSNDDNGNGRTHFYEKTRWWQKLSIYAQTTINNLVNDKTRFIATLSGVVGCTILIVLAMSLIMSVKNTPLKQFSDITLYDETVFCDMRADNARDSVEDVLITEDVEYVPMYQEIAFVVDGDGAKNAAILYVPEQTDNIKSFFSLKGVGVAKPTLTDDGLLISNTYASHTGAKVGDTLELMNTGGESFFCTVTGITEHYSKNVQIMMTQKYYESITGENGESNSFLVNLNGTDEAMLKSKLQEADGYFSMTNDREKWIGLYMSELSLAYMCGGIALVLALIMSMLVLLNLNVMFINEKTRELIIMRINGYSLRNAKKYIYRDNIVMTALGILLGIILGLIFARINLTLLESGFSNFYKVPNVFAVLVGIGSSALFSLIANIIALRRVEKLKLSDLSK